MRQTLRRIVLETWHERRVPIRLRRDEQPSPEAFAVASAQCRGILHDNIAGFFLPASLDRRGGGYLEDEKAGCFFARGDKFVTMQARYLWFCSLLMDEGIVPDLAREAADHGFAFIELAFKDRAHGGYYARIVAPNRPSDPRKHVYHQSFVLFALSRYALASGNQAAFRAADALFETIDARAYDSVNGGYAEFFTADWRPFTDDDAPRYDLLLGARSLDTHLHVLEALCEYYRARPSDRVRARLNEIATLVTLAFQHPRHAAMVNYWWPEWRMVARRENYVCSYGHDLELIWLTLDAARLLHMPIRGFKGWAQRISHNVLRFGFDPAHGGVFFAGPFGRHASDRRKEWWVQAEALVAFLEMFRLTGDPAYYGAFKRTLDFVQAHQVAADGGWWKTLEADGAPRVRARASEWQGAYHTGRSMASCARILQALAAEDAPETAIGGAVAGDGP